MGNKNGKLSAETIAALTERTDFTETEIKKWYKRFSKNCVDETLSVDSFLKIYGRYFPHGDASKFSRRVFTTFDKDGNGSIDFNEFITTLNVTSHGTLEEKLVWAFKLYDIDSNGYITRDELAEIVNEIYEMVGTFTLPQDNKGTEKIVDMIFSQMDANGDGNISMMEFVEGGKTKGGLLSSMLQVDEKPFERNLLKRPNK